MVYDRRIDDDTLSFEASGALEGGALVMRDRETDSWWSVMASRAIAGDREGTTLRELPAAVKTTWGEWRARHPHTLVLSVAGRTHVEENAYREYFESERTYRDAAPADDRLPPKTPIFAFRHGDKAVAVPHARIEGGILLRIDEGPSVVLLHRDPGAPLFESTRAYRLPESLAESDDAEGLARRIERELADGTSGGERLAGFDTYWYTWAPRHPRTRIMP